MRMTSLMMMSALLLAACSNGKQTDADSDIPPVPDTAVLCITDDDCSEGFACADNGLCAPVDGDNSFEEATSILFNEEATGIINPAGDIDYFVFETNSPGQWVTIQTINERTVVDDLDTVIRLYESNGLEHAAADNFDIYRISGADSRIIAYLPNAGQWFVTVEDVSTYYDLEEKRGEEDYEYTLQVDAFTGVVTEAGPLAVTLERGTQIASRAILLATEGDVDEIVLDVPFDDRVVEISGGTDIPGSDAIPDIKILKDGEVVSHQRDLGDGNYAHVFHSEAGSYTIQATDAAGAGSNDHWYVLYMRTYDEDGVVTFWGTSDYDYETEPNEDTATASASTSTSLTTTSGLDYVTNNVEGIIDADGDIDVYTFDVPAGQLNLTVRCYGDRFGSTADLAFDLLDGDGNVLETVTNYQTWSAPQTYNYEVTAGTHHIRVYAEDDAFGPAAFYRCQMLRTDWTVAE